MARTSCASPLELEFEANHRSNRAPVRSLMMMIAISDKLAHRTSPLTDNLKLPFELNEVAYVAVHFEEGDPSLDDASLIANRVMLSTLKATGTEVPIVVMVSPNVRDSSRSALENDGYRVIESSALHPRYWSLNRCSSRSVDFHPTTFTHTSDECFIAANFKRSLHGHWFNTKELCLLIAIFSFNTVWMTYFDVDINALLSPIGTISPMDYG